MNEAYVFQHNTTGVQIFVYHCISEDIARMQFSSIVIDYRKWIFIGKKIATNVN